MSQKQTLYDAQPAGTVVRGDVTSTQAAPAYNAGWVTTASAGFDAYGRQMWAADANGNTTRTTYNPATGLLPVQKTATNPAGWSTTVSTDRGRGVTESATDANGRTTDAVYDGFGRVVRMWTASHSKAANPQTPVQIFTYKTFGNTYANGITPNSYVETQTLREDGSYGLSFAILDGFGEQIQTQSTPADNSAGMVYTQSEYNSLGKAYRTFAPNPDAAHAPSGTFHNYGDALPSQTFTTYDGLSRPLTVATYHNGAPLAGAVTTTAYPGVDRTDVTAPAGNGVAAVGAASTFTDVRGRTSALWAYHNSPPSPTGNAADADRTTYGFAYIAGGSRSTVTDATGQTSWTTTTADLLGRHVVKTDPDAGTTASWSDNAGQLLQSVDGRGQTLSYAHDNLGRKTAEYNTASTELTLDRSGNITGINTAAPPPADSTKLASWTFDSVPGADGKPDKGLPTASTRYTSGGANAYVEQVTGYDAAGQPIGASVTIPGGENNGSLAGTYTTNNYYTPVTGLLDHMDLPVGGGLPSETVYNSYNVNGLLMASGGNADYIVDTVYDQMGRTLSRTLDDYPYQVVEQNLYDPATGSVTNTYLDATAGQNSANTSQLNTYTADELTYAYDPAGRLTSVADLQNHTVSGTYNPGNQARDNQCFTYDYAGRLTNAWADAGDQSPPSAITEPTQPSTAPGAIGSCADSTTNNPPTGYTALGGPAPYWQSYTYDVTGAAGLGNGTLTGNRSTIIDHATTSTGTDITRTSAFPGAQSVNNAAGASIRCTDAGYTCGPHQLTGITASGGASGSDSYSYKAR